MSPFCSVYINKIRFTVAWVQFPNTSDQIQLGADNHIYLYGSCCRRFRYSSRRHKIRYAFPENLNYCSGDSACNLRFVDAFRQTFSATKRDWYLDKTFPIFPLFHRFNAGIFALRFAFRRAYYIGGKYKYALRRSVNGVFRSRHIGGATVALTFRRRCSQIRANRPMVFYGNSIIDRNLPHIQRFCSDVSLTFGCFCPLMKICRKSYLDVPVDLIIADARSIGLKLNPIFSTLKILLMVSKRTLVFGFSDL